MARHTNRQAQQNTAPAPTVSAPVTNGRGKPARSGTLTVKLNALRNLPDFHGLSANAVIEQGVDALIDQLGPDEAQAINKFVELMNKNRAG